MLCFREEKDDDDEGGRRENLVEESNKVGVPMASSDVANEAIASSSSSLNDSVTTNRDAQVAQDAATTPAASDVKPRSNSSSELLSPMHDHTYALPSLLITPTMMAAMDSQSLAHKGYTCLSKVGQISTPPQLPAENSALKKSVEFLKETHKHLGT